MKSLTTTELMVLAGNAVARSMKSGTVKPIHHVVMTRLSNAAAIADSVAALNASESK